MNILILGATGYLGYNICESLLTEGNSVSCIVRTKSNITVVKQLIDLGADIYYKENGIKSILSDNTFDWIINTTCVYKQNEEGYMDMLNANLMFPLEVLNYSSYMGKSRFMTIGTGLPKDFNMYSYTKYSLSEFGKRLCAENHMLFIELRAEMFYGKNEPPNRFLQMCINKMLHNEKLELTDGTQLRDIMRIEDLLQAVQVLLQQQNLQEGYYVYEVGTGQAVSIREIVKYMYARLQSQSEIVFGAIPSRMNEPDCVANITALKEIGFHPQYSWREGLDKLIEEKRAGQP